MERDKEQRGLRVWGGTGEGVDEGDGGGGGWNIGGMGAEGSRKSGGTAGGEWVQVDGRCKGRWREM